MVESIDVERTGGDDPGARLAVDSGAEIWIGSSRLSRCKLGGKAEGFVLACGTLRLVFHSALRIEGLKGSVRALAVAEESDLRTPPGG